MDYYQLTIDRRSTREFKEKEVSPKALEELKKYYGTCKRLVEDIATELRLIDPDTSPIMNGCVGYKDYLIEAPAYMLILSEPKENYLENAGFIGEDMVLKLTDLGLDSCWLTINDAEKLADRLKIQGGMVPAALVAFGYGKAEGDAAPRLDIINPSNVNLKARTGYAAPKLFVEDAIYAEDMGIKENYELLHRYTDLYKGLISACCAPSFLNRQPYRFVIQRGRLILVALPDEETGANDSALNLGILMLNLYRTMTERSGVYGNWVMGAPKEDCPLPEGGKAVAGFNI